MKIKPSKKDKDASDDRVRVALSLQKEMATRFREAGDVLGLDLTAAIRYFALKGLESSFAIEVVTDRREAKKVRD